MAGLTKREFQIKYNISDEIMKNLEWLMKEFHGKEIKFIDSKKGLPIKNGK